MSSSGASAPIEPVAFASGAVPRRTRDMEIEDLAVPVGSRRSSWSAQDPEEANCVPRARTNRPRSMPRPDPNMEGTPAGGSSPTQDESGTMDAEHASAEMFQLCLNCTCELSRPAGSVLESPVKKLVPCDTCDCPAGAGPNNQHPCRGKGGAKGEGDREGKIPADGELVSPPGDSASIAIAIEQCDACPQCKDTCSLQHCRQCDRKRAAIGEQESKKNCKVPKFTMCQVKRHTTIDDCWLVANGRVYDVTAYVQLNAHPAGIRT